MTKYIFVTGGVVSSLGKGIASAGLAALLQSRGYSVRIKKLDPYLNVDPGTMSPHQHGEVYVTEDGAETDLDLGHYERFNGVNVTKDDNITSGKLYQNIIKKERLGLYLGKTVQMIPHLTEEIKDFIKKNESNVDFMICEIGGTVGDIESLPFVEAIRQFSNDTERQNTLFLHLTLIPYISAAKEIKTKPTQHSVKELLSLGIQPDILLLRSEHEITDKQRKKISLFCNVKIQNVIPAYNVETIYRIPLVYHEHKLDTQVLQHFNMESRKAELSNWQNIVQKIVAPSNGSVTVAVIGKYMELLDAYKSLIEALNHGGIQNDCKVNINWVHSESSDKEILKQLQTADSILVPGGYGSRGLEGKISAIKYARENNIPFLGICLGMQLATIEFARNVLNIEDATSSEIASEGTHIVGLLEEWQKDDSTEIRSKNDELGGTMRLGAYPCILKDNTTIQRIYQKHEISERHRHRYEINTTFVPRFEKAGMTFSGFSPDGKLPETIELDSHKFFIAVQYHPELKSRPFSPHPLFVALIKSSLEHKYNE